ncbi:MAG: NAD(P)H-hydrate dehydratase [Solobacterium sp.]|nr:NAD(P)H-hydrate dehydratase [Solobacterium sp.]
MITDKEGMKAIEAASGIPVQDLMEMAGSALAERIARQIPAGSAILILCGRGNNGGDGYVICRKLAKQYKCRVYPIDGKPASPAAKHAWRRLPRGSVIKEDEELQKMLKEADLIVDAVYGFGFHGCLPAHVKELFSLINRSRKTVWSIDINSGCECDNGLCDTDALRSELTLAIDCFKPFHLLRKEHGMFQKAEIVSLGLPHPSASRFHQMNEELFFSSFPKKAENTYKGTYGKTLLIGGCYGMAGAVGLNLLGARTVGAPYILTAVPEEIYPTTAGYFMTPVFHPFGEWTWHQVIEPLLSQSSAIAFGSGAAYMTHKEDILDLILQESRVPVVLDASALRLLSHNMYILRFAKAPVILTPHIGEFSAITGLPVSVIRDQKIRTASDFAKDYHVTVVLKGSNTIVAFPDGGLYINQTGNPALAQAGAGDLLTGMMAGILTMTRDVDTAVCMAVWLHGALADLGIQEHSVQGFDLAEYPRLMDSLFRKHGF